MERKYQFGMIVAPCFYMMIDGKLTFVNVEIVDYRKREDGVILGTMKVKDGGGNEYTIQESEANEWPSVYKSEDAFKEGAPMDTCWQSFEKTASLRFRNIGEAHLVPGGKVFWWVMKNGEPVFVEREITHFTWTPMDGLMLCDDAVPPTVHYSSRENCLSWSEWTSKDEDGKEMKHVGASKLVELDDDQKEMVEMFKNLYKNMKDSGIGIVADMTDNVKVFNTRHLKDWSMAYDKDDLDMSTDENPDDYEEVDFDSDKFFTICLPVWSEETRLFINRMKDERKSESSDTEKE